MFLFTLYNVFIEWVFSEKHNLCSIKTCHLQNQICIYIKWCINIYNSIIQTYIWYFNAVITLKRMVRMNGVAKSCLTFICDHYFLKMAFLVCDETVINTGGFYETVVNFSFSKLKR